MFQKIASNQQKAVSNRQKMHFKTPKNQQKAFTFFKSTKNAFQSVKKPTKSVLHFSINKKVLSKKERSCFASSTKLNKKESKQLIACVDFFDWRARISLTLDV
jgi:hypothetical protein